MNNLPNRKPLIESSPERSYFKWWMIPEGCLSIRTALKREVAIGPFSSIHTANAQWCPEKGQIRWLGPDGLFYPYPTLQVGWILDKKTERAYSLGSPVFVQARVKLKQLIDYIPITVRVKDMGKENEPTVEPKEIEMLSDFLGFEKEEFKRLLLLSFIEYTKMPEDAGDCQ